MSAANDPQGRAADRAARHQRGNLRAPKLDTLPPHDAVAEAGILGCILLESIECGGGIKCLTQCLEQFGGFDPFYDLRHSDIFLAMSNMRAIDQPIDFVTLGAHLRSVKKLDQVGGQGYFDDLCRAASNPGNIANYLDIVWSKYLARRAVQHHSAVVAEVLEAGDLTEPAIVRAREGLDHIERELHRTAGVTPKYLIRASAIAEEASQRFFHDPRKGEPGWLLPIDFKFRIRLQETTIMIGDDKTGKSTILLYFLLHLASQGGKCAGALMEEAADKSLWLLASQLLGQRHLPECEQSRATITDAMAWLNQRFMFYAFLGIADWRDILATFRYAAEHLAVNVFLIDSVMRIGIPDDDYSTQHAAANAFAQFAMDYNAHLIYVSHENKGEGKGKKKARGSALWTAAAHNILRIEKNDEKQLKIDGWYQDIADARSSKPPDETFIRETEAKIEKMRKMWDTRITMQGQRFPGSQQNAAKRFWFDYNCFQFREHFDDTPVNWLTRWKKKSENGKVEDREMATP